MSSYKSAAARLVHQWNQRPIPWIILGIALIAFLTYANSLGNYFLIDDFWHFDKSSKTSWSGLLKPWTYSGEDFKAYWFNEQRLQGTIGRGYFRPIVTGLYKVSLKAFGLDAWYYHLVSILSHVATSVVVFAIARLFFKATWIAAITALLFAAHPSHAECVQWVAANCNVIEGLFSLTGFATFGWYLKQGKHRTACGSGLKEEGTCAA